MPYKNVTAQQKRDPREIFAENLRAVMADQKLKQHTLADMIGVSRPMVSRWVTGKALPGAEEMLQLSAALFWDYSRMFTDYSRPREESPEERQIKGAVEKLIAAAEEVRRLVAGCPGCE